MHLKKKILQFIRTFMGMLIQYLVYIKSYAQLQGYHFRKLVQLFDLGRTGTVNSKLLIDILSVAVSARKLKGPRPSKFSLRMRVDTNIEQSKTKLSAFGLDRTVESCLMPRVRVSCLASFVRA